MVGTYIPSRDYIKSLSIEFLRYSNETSQTQDTSHEWPNKLQIEWYTKQPN